MAIIAGQINPANYPQPDYSGVVRSAQMQAQGLADIGKSISGVIDNFGEAKKEQKKVDAYNKASAKSIEAAITLGNSYGIAGAESTLRPFLEAYNDPNLSPIEKAALLDEGKAMIPNVFGRFDQSQANAIQQAQVSARNAPPLPEPLTYKREPYKYGSGELQGTQRGSDGQLYDENFNLIRDINAYAEGKPVEVYSSGAGQSAANAIDAGLNLPFYGGVGESPPMIYGPDGNLMLLPPPEGTTPPSGEPPASVALPRPAPQLKSRVVSEDTKQQGIIVNQEQLNNLVAQGAKVDFLPRGDGTYIVSGTTIGGKPLVEVNTAESTQQERAKAMDKFLFDERAKLQGAVANKDSIKKMISLIDEGVKTGFSQDVIMQFNRAFGKDVSNSETFKSVSGNVAMGFINLTKGAISDREMTYFTTVLAPNLGNTPEGNRKIGEFMLKAVEKAEKIEKVISEGMRNGKSSFDIDDEVRKIKNVDTLLPSDASTTANPKSVNEFASTPEEDALVEEFKSKNK